MFKVTIIDLDDNSVDLDATTSCIKNGNQYA